MKRYLLTVGMMIGGLFYLPTVSAQQQSATNKDDIEYEAISDDPYDMNKMWLHFYPAYADAFLTSLSAGFGVQGQYLWKNKMDFRVQARIPYYKGTDFGYGIGLKTKDVANSLSPMKYVELGATYHIIDKADQGEAKIIVYNKRYSPGKWAATVPEFIMVPAKVRKIVGIRAGGIFWGGSTNLTNAMENQKVNLQSSDGHVLTRNITLDDGTTQEQHIYSTISSTAVYLGGSLGRIRNVVVKPKKYDIAVNDVIFTGYADLIYAPTINIGSVMQKDSVGTMVTYSTDNIKKSPFGFRAGFEGMYNREFSWSYGAEVGMRPSIQGSSFFVTVKVGFAFASRLDQRRQAYQREK